ncbi:hypothetical protein BDR22DRAFT_54897 [Usnea florida]
MSRVCTNPDSRIAPGLAARPSFGAWDALFFLDRSGMTLSDADEVIFGHWDDYADQAIGVLHRMIQQTERLVFSNDEYTNLVRTFQAFPHRPNLSSVLRDVRYDERESVTEVIADGVQTPAQTQWHKWADRVEEIHRNLAEKMSRCRPKLVDEEEEDLGFASLSIAPPKTETLTGLLHKILDSASEPDEEQEDAQTGLESHLQLMGF